MATPYKLINSNGEKITDIKSISNFTPADVERLVQYIIEKVEAFGDFSTPGLWNNISADARDLVSNWNNSVKTLWDALKESDPDALATLGLGSINIQDLLIGDAIGTEAENYLDPTPEENKLGQKYIEARHDEIKMNIKNMDYTNRELDSDGKPISPIASALNLLMPRYARRVEVEDLDKNFWVISAALDAALTSLFDPNGLVPSMLKEICEIWQNISNLWRLLSELITYMNNMFALLGLGDVDSVAPYAHGNVDPRIGLYEITYLHDFDIQLRTSTGTSRIIKSPFRNFTFGSFSSDTDPRKKNLSDYCIDRSGQYEINESQFFLLAQAGAAGAAYVSGGDYNNLGQFNSALTYKNYCLNHTNHFFALPELFTIVLYDPSFYRVKSDKTGLEFIEGKNHEMPDEVLSYFDKSNFNNYTVYLRHNSLFNGEILLQQFKHMHMQHSIPKIGDSYWTNLLTYFYKTSCTNNDNVIKIIYVNKDTNSLDGMKKFGEDSNGNPMPLRVSAYWSREETKTNEYVIYGVDYDGENISTPNYFSTVNGSDTRIVITSGPGYANGNAVGDNNASALIANGRMGTMPDGIFARDGVHDKRSAFINYNGLKIRKTDDTLVPVSTKNIENVFYSSIYNATAADFLYNPAAYYNVKMRNFQFLNQFKPTKVMIEMETGASEYYEYASEIIIEGYSYNENRVLPSSLDDSFQTWGTNWNNIPTSLDALSQITWDTSSLPSHESTRLATNTNNAILEVPVDSSQMNKYYANFVIAFNSALRTPSWTPASGNYCRYGGFRIHGYTEAGCHDANLSPLFSWS